MSRYPSPSDINWSAGVGEVPNYINQITGGVFINLLLFAIAFIVGSSFYLGRKDIFGALAVGSFSAWTVGLIMWVAGWLSGINFSVVTAVMIICVASLWIPRE